MDPRIRNHAETVVEHSTSIQRDDTVLITAAPGTEPLLRSLYELLGEHGAAPLTLRLDDRATAAYLQAAGEDVPTPEHRLAAIQASDVSITLQGGANERELSGVPPAALTAFHEAHAPVQEEMLTKRWCGTQYPTPAAAQEAEMSTDAYEDFVWNAINQDWEQQRQFQAQMAEKLAAGDEVRVSAGETTEITMSIEGNPASNEAGEKNLPGGEVATAPIPDSVEGEVLFDLPVVTQGTEMEGVHLVFEEGRVVEYSADSNEDTLAGLLETDDGARRIGEFGIGMNRDIDRFTNNIAFDEKMGDTVHFALGRAFEGTVAQHNERNESAIHVDMLVDMSEDAVIEIDGHTVQRDGTFRFEDDFVEA